MRVATAAAAASLFGLAAVAAVAGTGDGGGTPAPAAFRLADGSAACNYLASGEIACRVAGAREATVLEPSGESRVDPDVLVAWDETAPVLLAAESWWNGPVSCRVGVADARIVCSAGGGSITVGGAAS